MRISSRAVIIENEKVLTMFRRKIKDGIAIEYYVLPGGGQENDETLQENVIRELKEEMNVDIEILGYLGSSTWKDSNSNFFHCKIAKGKPCLNGEELERMSEENYYEPRFINVKDLENIDLKDKEFVFKALKQEYIKLR